MTYTHQGCAHRWRSRVHIPLRKIREKWPHGFVPLGLMGGHGEWGHGIGGGTRHWDIGEDNEWLGHMGARGNAQLLKPKPPRAQATTSYAQKRPAVTCTSNPPLFRIGPNLYPNLQALEPGRSVWLLQNVWLFSYTSISSEEATPLLSQSLDPQSAKDTIQQAFSFHRNSVDLAVLLFFDQSVRQPWQSVSRSWLPWIWFEDCKNGKPASFPSHIAA